MAQGPDSTQDVSQYRSSRGPLLLTQLIIALVFGTLAYVVIHTQLLTPLQQQATELRSEHQAHVQDVLQADLNQTRHFAAAFHAIAGHRWGDSTSLRELASTLLAEIPGDSAIVAAGIWPAPGAFDKRQERFSLYWTIPANGGAPQAHDDYNNPDLISYFGEVWYAPMREASPERCHFTPRYQEPFLKRPVIACATPVVRDGQFLGVTSLVIDPQRWNLTQTASGESSFSPYFLLLDDQLQVLRAGGVSAQAGDNLPSLAQRDPLFGPVSVYLHQLVDGRTRAIAQADPLWEQKVAQVAERSRQLSELQAGILLARLQTETEAANVHELTATDAEGQDNDLRLVPLAGLGTLILGQPRATAMAGLPLAQLVALAATLGVLLIALLLAHGLSIRRVLKPLRQLLEQLQLPAEDTVVEIHGHSELAVLATRLNQRHDRIRQLLRDGNGKSPRPSATANANGNSYAAGGAEADVSLAVWHILDAFPDSIVLTDEHGHIEYLNTAAQSLSGWTLEAARNLSFDEVFHLSDRRGRQRLTQLPSRAMQAGRPSERPLAVQYTTRSGHKLPLSVSSGPYRAPKAKQPSGVLLMLHDARHDGIAASAGHTGSIKDNLTGMLNRQAFDAELTARCDATRLGGEPPFHLLYIDVDKLSRINGGFGTEAGDELLRQLARLIQSDVGEHSPVYRLHGDKFGALLETEDSAEAQVTAELLRADAQSWGFQWSGKTSDVSISASLIKVGRDSGRPVDVLRSAAELCDKAQMEGGGKVLVGEARTQRQEPRDERHWLNNIKRGLAEDRFHLSTQQINPMQRDLEAAGEVYDTLLLLEDDEGFWTGSDVFMPFARNNDLAAQLDRWTFEHVFNKLQQDETLYQKIDFCVVSVSLGNSQNMALLDFLMEKFQSTGIARTKICVDLHESDVQSRLSTAKEFCLALARAGCRLSLSGASTQPSSYKLIQELPVQLVRFDPIITSHAAKDPLDRLATESLHRIVHALQKKSMVTGVDTPELLRVMQGIGIDYAQGNAVARATPMLFQAQV